MNGKVYSFDYNSPASVCGIPDAGKVIGLTWGIFAALLLTTVVCVSLWLKRRRNLATNVIAVKLSQVTAMLHHKRMHVPMWVADAVWFFASDVAYYIYSQVTDAITIHQVFKSGQDVYAFLLLAILLLPLAFMFLLVVALSVRTGHEKAAGRKWYHRGVACLLGLVVSPVLFVTLEIGLIFHGVGISMPHFLKPADVDIFSYYRAQSVAESLLNALPQSIIQSKLYLMGNDPHGVHVYITLFLYSITGSLSSLLKSVAVVMIEVHQHHDCKVLAYFVNLVKLLPVKKYLDFADADMAISRANS